MIRVHIIMLLALAQAIFSERLVLQLNTGGRGMVMITNLFDPWVTLAVVILPFWSDLKKVLWTRTFLGFWSPFLLLSFALPFLGVAFTGYPVRTCFAAWNAIIPFTFLTIGAAGAFHAEGAGKLIRRYFLFAIFAQLGLAFVQTAGQFEYLPSLMRPIYEWDFRFKELYQPDNLILGRATGFYLNPNSLGIWALLAFWASFFLLKGKQRAVGAVASFITILLCQSRGTLAAFLGSGTVYFVSWMLFQAQRQERLRATLLAALAIVPITVLTLPGLADSMLGSMKNVPVVGHALERYTSGAKVLSQGAEADANFKGRTEYWHAAADFLAENPFGSLGSPEMVVKVPPDNQYIAVLEQGSFYFLTGLLLTFWGGLRLLNGPNLIGRVLAVSTLAIMINGISAVPFAYPAAFIYWLLVGVYLGTRRRDLERQLLEETP